MDENIPQQSSACAGVFNLPELLDMILLQIPIKDLLLSQRVCKTWQTTIENSTRLQQALFFKPLPVQPLANSYDVGDSFAWLKQQANGPRKWFEPGRPTRTYTVFKNPLWLNEYEFYDKCDDGISYYRMLATQPPIETTGLSGYMASKWKLDSEPLCTTDDNFEPWRECDLEKWFDSYE